MLGVVSIEYTIADVIYGNSRKEAVLGGGRVEGVEGVRGVIVQVVIEYTPVKTSVLNLICHIACLSSIFLLFFSHYTPLNQLLRPSVSTLSPFLGVCVFVLFVSFIIVGQLIPGSISVLGSSFVNQWDHNALVYWISWY